MPDQEKTGERVKMFERPLRYYVTNLFVLTEHRAYFVPYLREFDWPLHERHPNGDLRFG